MVHVKKFAIRANICEGGGLVTKSFDPHCIQRFESLYRYRTDVCDSKFVSKILDLKSDSKQLTQKWSKPPKFSIKKIFIK